LTYYGGSVDLHQQIGKIQSKEDLADFVAALRLDLEANPEKWENPTLERFLSAMEDWISGAKIQGSRPWMYQVGEHLRMCCMPKKCTSERKWSIRAIACYQQSALVLLFSSMKSFLRSVVVAVLTISAYAQTTRRSTSEWSSKSERAAEDAVASKFEMIRASAKRPALKRVNPSMIELELVCTAALTGRTVGDPVMGGLETYATDDLSAETEPLKELTLGRAYPTKKWPRYSVIVERNASSKPEHPEYTVGVARRPSAALEFFAPLFSDVPFKGINEWKKQVAPDCKNRKTESSR
jgi:hypothetical protein